MAETNLTPDELEADHAAVTVPYPILDGARGQARDLILGVEAQRNIAADVNQDLNRRMEAYEDIIDSEIGDTTMVRARNLERAEGLRQIYLKFEGGNPTGTQKDRIAFAQASDAMRRGYDTVAVATCGNYGVAIALACNLAGLRSIVHLPATYQTRRIKELEELGARIERVEGDYEHAVDVSKEVARKEEYYDANPGGANTTLQLLAYERIAYEIYDDLRDAPYAIAVSVSNGTTLAGIYKGFVSLYRRGKTSRLPRLVAGSSARKNPIVASFLSNLDSCLDLPPQSVRETHINEPLINWHSTDGDLALSAIRATGGWAHNASDKNMLATAGLLRSKEGLNALAASTAGLLGLLARHRKKPLPRDRYVAVLTGRK
jgi:threonine synthase